MQTRSKFFDDMSQLMTNAMGVAQGAKTEAETAMKGFVDRWLADRNFVTREEFDAVRAMAQKAREENAALAARLAALEAAGHGQARRLRPRFGGLAFGPEPGLAPACIATALCRCPWVALAVDGASIAKVVRSLCGTANAPLGISALYWTPAARFPGAVAGASGEDRGRCSGAGLIRAWPARSG